MLGQLQVLQRRCDPFIQRVQRSSPPLFNAISFIWINFKPIIVLFVIAYCSSNIVDSYNRTNSAWISSENFVNTYCIENPDHCQSSLSFQKILIFYMDGLPFDQFWTTASREAFDIHNFPLFSNLIFVTQTSSHLYHIYNVPFQSTYGVVTSYLTGKPATNVMGAPVECDNFIAQFNTAGVPIHYYGQTDGEAFYDLMRERTSLWDGVTRVEEDTYHDRAFYTLFGANKDAAVSKESAHIQLNKFKSDSKSALITTQIVDKLNHKTMNKYDTHTTEIISQFTEDMRIVRQWIDENPEYLLVVMSDHGGAWPDDNILSTHGTSDNGNEAFMMMYNPKLKPLSQEAWLDTVDVAGTLSQYIRAASIPAESNGVAYAASESLKERINLYRHTSFQLLQNAKHLGVRLGSIVNRFGPEDQHNLDVETAKDSTWKKYLGQLKYKLEDFHAIPVFSMLFYLLAALATYISLTTLEFGSLQKFCAMLKARFWLIIVPIFIVFGYPLLFSMLNVEFWWGENRQIFLFIHALLVAGALYNTSMDQETSPSDDLENGNNNEKIRRKAIIDEDEMKSPSHNIRYWLFVGTAAGVIIAVYSNSFVQVRKEIGRPEALHVLTYLVFYLGFGIWMWQRFEEYQQAIAAQQNNLDRELFMNGTIFKMTRVIYFMAFAYFFAFESMGRASEENAMDIDSNHSVIILGLYPALIAHTVILLIFNGVSRRLAVVPMTMLLFVLFTDEERLYLVFGTLVLNSYSKIVHTSNMETKVVQFAGPHLRKFAFLLMMNQAYWLHEISGGNYDLGDTKIFILGVHDHTEHVTLAGILFSIHKFAFFFLMPLYLICMITPQLPLTQQPAAEKIQKSLQQYIWRYFLTFFFASLFFFELGLYVFRMPINFVFTCLAIAMTTFYSLSMTGDSFTAIIGLCCKLKSGSRLASDKTNIL